MTMTISIKKELILIKTYDIINDEEPDERIEKIQKKLKNRGGLI